MCAVSFGKTAIPETATTENKKQIIALVGAGHVDFEAIAFALANKPMNVEVIALCQPGTVAMTLSEYTEKYGEIKTKPDEPNLQFTIPDFEYFAPVLEKPKGNWRTNYKTNKSRFAQKFTAQRHKTPRDNI